MRRYFVQLVSTHLPEIEPRPSMENIDDFVMYLVGLVVNAKRVDRPNPVPWFTDACAFLLEADMAEGLGIKPAPPSRRHYLAG